MASVITNLINTEFRVVGNQVMAQMGQFAGSTRAWARELDGVQNMSERLQAQWRAMATTIRYSIAGAAIFGLTRMVTQLKDMQVQLGLISAIGQTPSGAPLQGRDLTNLMDDIRRGAIESVTPVNEYSQAVVNLLSTLQNVPTDEISPMVTQIAQASRLAQVSAEDLTKAVTTIPVAFGNAQPGLEDIHRFAQEFFILTKEAPGGITAGQQIIQQVGQLAAITRAAHGTPEEMFALTLSGLRGGIPPAQAGRSLQFMLQTLAFPGAQVAPSRAALASVGITPLSNMTLPERLDAIFKRAGVLGIQGNLSNVMNLDDDTISQLDATGDATQSLQSLGVSGQGALFLGTVFRRIHALRMALALSTQAESGQLQKDMQTMDDASKGIVSDSNDLAKATKRFQDQAPLQKAAVALDELRLQVAQAVFGPTLSPVAKVLSGTAEQAAKHPRITQIASIAGAIAGLGIFGRRLFTGKGARGLDIAENAISLANANGPLGSSVVNPMYVKVVGDLFGLMPQEVRVKVEGEGKGKTVRTGGPGEPPILIPGPGEKAPPRGAPGGGPAAGEVAAEGESRVARVLRAIPGLGAALGLGIAGRRRIGNVLRRIPVLGRLIGRGGGAARAGEGILGRMGAARLLSLPFTWEGQALIAASYYMHDFQQSILGKDDPLRQYSGSQGFGELYRDVKKHLGGSGLDYAKSASGFLSRIFGATAANAATMQPVINAQRARLQGGVGGGDFSIQAKNGEITLNINVKHPDGTASKAKLHTPYGLHINGNAPSQSGTFGKGRR